MSKQIQTVKAGFGERLKTERRRLGLTQEAFAEKAGVQRLAQSQYESGLREPRLSYLAAVGHLGANLDYLLYEHPHREGRLSDESARKVEIDAFKLVDEYIQVRCGGSIDYNGRYVLFEIIRRQLTNAVLTGTEPVGLDVMLGAKAG